MDGEIGDYSPGAQVGIMQCLATISANLLALLFFFTIGFDRPEQVIIGTTCTTVLVSAPLGAFLVSLNFKMKQVAAQLDHETRTDSLTVCPRGPSSICRFKDKCSCAIHQRVRYTLH